MTTTPSPAQLKAHLGQVKETILDSFSYDSQECINILISAELVQRGVLLPLDAVVASGADDATSKLMDAVQSTAGRPLFDATSSTIPKPMLAAASAMAGMISEKCASAQDGRTRHKQNADTAKQRKGALRRCQEVQDDRLACLLRLQDYPTPPGDVKDEETIRHERLRLRRQLLHIAEGYFLRAASFQPDTPQMWKKSLDVIVARNQVKSESENKVVEEAWEASIPLACLMEIAERKGNQKRVSELSLRLAESLLGKPEKPDSPEETKIVDSFVIPYRPTAEPRSATDSISDARSAMEKCKLDLIQDDATNVLWHKLLLLRIEWAHEDSLVDLEAQQIQTSARNRDVTLSMDACLEKARSKVWGETFVGSAVDSAAINLRDHVLSTDISNVVPRSSAAETLLSKQCKRLVDRARAMSLSASSNKKSSVSRKDADSAWYSVGTFVGPALTYLEDHTKDSLEPRESERFFMDDDLLPSTLDLIESSLTALGCCLWMTSAQSPTNTDWTADGDLHIAAEILLELIVIRTRRQKQSSEDGIVKSAPDRLERSINELQCACVSVSAFAALADRDGDNTGAEEEIVEIESAIRMSENADKYASFQGKYGTSYLQFLVCWSGLFRSAWSLCNVSQARMIIRQAREAVTQSVKEWGRDVSPLESLLLDIGEADAEGGYLGGGLEHVAEAKYKSTLDGVDTGTITSNLYLKHLIKAHALRGLASMNIRSSGSDGGGVSDRLGEAEKLSRQALEEAEKAESAATSETAYLWGPSSALAMAARYQISAARQQVADCLVRSGQPEKAAELFRAAVRDAPLNFDAALALGAFLLRMAFRELAKNESLAPEKQKAVQVQLLKAAKLDPQKAYPFALLGIWYEEQEDEKRAIGCFSKALLLDVSNPVAGRGILRLKEVSAVKGLCENAVNMNSPSSGWAWRALGRVKAIVDGRDDLAAICFHKALRCKDVECPWNEPFGAFFHAPSESRGSVSVENEQASVWIELAQSYRRLARHSAAVRAFASAWALVRERMSSIALCSWAQVELELGLSEEAAEKFALVISRGDSFVTIAAYGQGAALLSLAQRDAQDGKCGSSFSFLRRGIDGVCDAFVCGDGKPSSDFRCALKLLGDLYSFGALLPPDVFVEDWDDSLDVEAQSARHLRAQLAFVAQGEDAYAAAGANDIGGTEEEIQTSKAAVICDLGANLLLQSQLVASLHGEGNGTQFSIQDIARNVEEVRDCFTRSAEVFKRAIDASPSYGPAWCGLGCAMSAIDPLVAQHAFSASLIADKTLADSWANLGFLYATNNEFRASAEMLDSLTQTADSPMMWIGRALMLESDAFKALDTEEVVAKASRAADAYRAALQVSKHPCALLGLSLTCRVGTASSTKDETRYHVKEKFRLESFSYMTEYAGTTASTNTAASITAGVMVAEDGVAKSLETRQVWSGDVLDNGLREIKRRSEAGKDVGIDHDTVASVERCISSIEETKDLHSSNDIHDPTAVTVMIMHDPEKAELWLEMAKSLALTMHEVSQSKKRKPIKEATQNAILTADRAASLLMSQVSKPVMVKARQHVSESCQSNTSAKSTAVPDIVSAQDVSEALSLAFLLRQVESQNDSTTKDDCAVDLQRSLFMCPDNRFAREAIAKVHSSEDL